MRLMSVIYGLGAGGAERVLALLAAAWVGRGHRVAIATFEDAPASPFFPLPASVVLRPLGGTSSWTGTLGRNLVRARRLRRVLRETVPDVAIAFGDVPSMVTILAAAGSGIPVIAREGNDPSAATRPLLSAVGRWTYLRADRVVVVTERMIEGLPRPVRRRSVTIPNPVLAPPSVPGAPAVERSRTVVAMGRMVDEKGFDLLLEAFARVAERHRQWSLLLLGDGPRREELEALRDRVGLTGRVHMPGLTRNPHGELARAGLFVLPSRQEGFPMALCEAMASGLPVIAFDCRTGPREIIRDGLDGMLVPPADVPALARALDLLLGDEEIRRRLAARAPEVIARFGLGKVLAMWDDVLTSAAEPSGTAPAG